MLEQRINEWAKKVISAKESQREERIMIDTYQMMVDIDRIISEEFDQYALLPENQ